MTIPQQIITVGLCVLSTMLTRFLPFFIFRENQETRLSSGTLGNFSLLQFSACSSSTA